MEKLLLIDGNSLINRAFYALPPLNNPEGTQVQAVYGFANMLIKMIETVKPNYIVTAFDMRAPTFRHKMYDGYKARRKGMPDELAAQMPILKSMLTAMGIKYIEKEGYEADDIIGTLAAKFPTETYIVTGDRDSFQLIDDKTRVLMTKRGITEVEEVTVETLLSGHGLTPQGVIEYKSLAGDSSDDIPGVPGVGEKTAMSLLDKYGDLDGIYAAIDEVTPASLKTKLTEGRDSAYLSRTLATIDRNAPIEFKPDECRYVFPFGERVFAFFESQNFKSLLKRNDIFSVSDEVKAAVPAARTKAERVRLSSVAEIEKLLAGKPEFAIHMGEKSVFVATDTQKEYVADFSRTLLDSGVNESELVSALKPILLNPAVTKVVYDSKSFISYIYRNYGFVPQGFFDAKLAQYIVDSTVPHGTLNELSDAHSVNAEEEIASGLLYIRSELCKSLREYGMERLYYEIELPLVKVLFDMEQAGFAVNRARLEEIGRVYNAEIEALSEKIYEAAGQTFNIKSPKQLAKVLFEDLKIPYPRKGAKTYNTSAETLEQLDSSYGIVPLVLRYRFLTKLSSTYVDGLRRMIDAQGTVHTEFRQTLTTTGRLSSVEPNLQNIPVREEDGKILRSLFIAREGYTLVTADYSQIELRIMAHYSQDPAMLAAYESGADIHTFTASRVFDVPLDKVTSDMRRTAKTVNFGIIYGISDFGLSNQLKISRARAKEIIDSYFARFGGVRAYLDDCLKKAKQTGYVTTPLGRRRKIPELFSSEYRIRQFGARAAMNMPLQGLAADIIKIAMLKVSRALEGMKSRLILQIHDELIVETAEDERDAVKKLLKENMENAYTLHVPLIAEVGEGKSWFDCK